MKVTDRIRAFLNDEPVKSDARGMFIERDDLRKLLEEFREISEDARPAVTRSAKNWKKDKSR
jgi:hypothetical protein